MGLFNGRSEFTLMYYALLLVERLPSLRRSQKARKGMLRNWIRGTHLRYKQENGKEVNGYSCPQKNLFRGETKYRITINQMVLYV